MHSVGIVILKCSYEIDIEGCVTLYRLRPVDVEFMRALHEKVNVVPLIAKADCLTPNEIKKLKDRVSRTQCVFAYGCVCVCVCVCLFSFAPTCVNMLLPVPVVYVRGFRYERKLRNLALKCTSSPNVILMRTRSSNRWIKS